MSTALAVPFEMRAASASPSLRARWSQILLWSVTLTLALVLAMVYRTHRPAPLGMSVKEHDGQLMIAWKPAMRGRLQILDGAWSTTIEIPPQLSRITYARRTGDVSVLLVSGGSEKLTRFVSREAGTPAQLSSEIRTISDQARSAQVQTESDLWRISQLQYLANSIMHRVEPPDPPPAKPSAKTAPRKRPAMTWWR